MPVHGGCARGTKWVHVALFSATNINPFIYLFVRLPLAHTFFMRSFTKKTYTHSVIIYLFLVCYFGVFFFQLPLLTFLTHFRFCWLRRKWIESCVQCNSIRRSVCVSPTTKIHLESNHFNQFLFDSCVCLFLCLCRCHLFGGSLIFQTNL